MIALGGGVKVLLTRESFFAGALGITCFASLLFPGRSCSTSASTSWPGRSRADRAVRGEMGGPLLPFREPRHHRRLGRSIQRRAPTAGRPGLHAAALGGPRRLPSRPRGITIATIVPDRRRLCACAPRPRRRDAFGQRIDDHHRSRGAHALGDVARKAASCRSRLSSTRAPPPAPGARRGAFPPRAERRSWPFADASRGAPRDTVQAKAARSMHPDRRMWQTAPASMSSWCRGARISWAAAVFFAEIGALNS